MAAAGQTLHNSSSTSEIHQSYAERQYSAPSNFGETSNPSLGGTTSNADPPTSLQGLEASPIWLECGPNERYLLLEDMETGDMLIPLIHLKKFFQSNYGRKITSLHNRLVRRPPGADMGPHEPSRQLYWVDCFESPPNVKALIRREYGEDLQTSKNSGHGRVRLALLPMVFNAMSMRKDLMATALYKALERALKASTYWPLLQPGERGNPAALQPNTPAGATEEPNGDEVDSNNQESPLFSGPKRLAATAAKYMSPFKEPPAKRGRRDVEEQALVEAIAKAKEHQEAGTEMQLAKLQGELAQQKRQCLMQSHRLARLEQELAEVKAFLGCLNQTLDEARRSSDKPPAKGGDIRDPNGGGDAFTEAYREASLAGQVRWDGQPGQLPAPLEVFNNLRGLMEQQIAPEPLSRTPPANPMRRHVSAGCLALPGRAQSGLLDPLPPSALTSHHLNLAPPMPAGAPIIPQLGLLGNPGGDAPSSKGYYYRLPAQSSGLGAFFDHPGLNGVLPPSPKPASGSRHC